MRAIALIAPEFRTKLFSCAYTQGTKPAKKLGCEVRVRSQRAFTGFSQAYPGYVPDESYPGQKNHFFMQVALNPTLAKDFSVSFYYFTARVMEEGWHQGMLNPSTN